MANGQNRPVTFDNAAVLQFQAGKGTVFPADTHHLGIEADFAPQREDPLADILHNGQQHIGTHMGLGIVEDILPGTGFDELLQDPADPWIVDTGVQLAVGEGTGTTLAELNIASCIQLTGFKELLHLFMAALGILAPLQDQRLQARHRQNEGCKHTCRAKANHNRPLFRLNIGFRHLIIGNGSNGSPLTAALLQNFLFAALYCHINGIDDAHIGFLPGIDAAADDPESPNFGRGNAQHLRRLKLQLVRIMLRRQGNIPQSDHSFILPAESPARRPELHAHCKL